MLIEKIAARDTYQSDCDVLAIAATLELNLRTPLRRPGRVQLRILTGAMRDHWDRSNTVLSALPLGAAMYRKGTQWHKAGLRRSIADHARELVSLGWIEQYDCSIGRGASLLRPSPRLIRLFQSSKRRRLIPASNSVLSDLVMTPRPLAKQIIQHFQPSGRLLDPCRGDGAFFDQMPGASWCEVSEDRDFFDEQQRYDWIVTNPPWSMVRQFTRHAMTLADNIIFLVTVNHFWTKARQRDLKEHGFGIAELFGVDTPKENGWPQNGFKLAAVHLRRGHKGPIAVSGTLTHE